MEQRAKFIGGLPDQEVDEAQLQDALHNMLKQTAKDGAPALGMITKLQERRAARLEVAAKGLDKELGKDHPDVVALKETSKTVAELNSRISIQNARTKSWPKVRPYEWAVFGSVVNVDNKPASGFFVRIYDRDRKYDDLLGESETDANGDFSIIYHERDFKETRENLPELYVMVSDPKGKLVYSSRDSVRFNSGQSEYFAIKLGKTVREAAPKPTAKTKPSATSKSTATPKPTADGQSATKVTRKKG
jgi:hypothetical protein